MASFTIVESLDQERWDKFVQEHPKGSIFHTSYMVEVFKRAKNHSPLFLAALDSAGEVAALLVAVRVQTLPDPLGSLSSRSIFYAEPLCREDACGQEALTALLENHDALMRDKVLFTEVRALGAANREKSALIQAGYAYEDYLNYLLPLRTQFDQLWHTMRNSCRANIRRGKKHGIIIQDRTSQEGVDTLYSLLQRTFERAKVPLADKSLFVEALRIFQPQDMIRVSIASYQDKPVAASSVLLYKKTVYQWYWGIEIIKSIYPAECITWGDIEWGHQHGYEIYDFGGAGWPNKPYGVRDFKAKFGGDLVNYGRYRKIYSPLKFALAERGYELIRNLMNPKAWSAR